ncbi:MAG TPA: hypothetical protein DEG17_00540 [Cyanobacteria bacterium UBA11149]|nr:hypothetical protein [Cyanobacteria bacterium UBA11367]HBE59957.1 hypothetical protein [Cyanobacteria bacterium UBA11366]HBK64340.1 hypothetical protein [Cyanobacteria bacterium UBA11166]HBR76469.1 hypothetical protein [Cyanobacteria bacterium UBA11159]HBS68043.1 hypothetical protein [Cyanobacteria bacterium UBA11153]HBW87405.1 hypothetical protein [Cyanobacteria bacterium UBA11149]HCA98126.1 hypothetical protein [Cyanobacteria bacterium UBA9226]
MTDNSKERVVFIAGGVGTGAGVYGVVGGVGLAGSFGAVGIGMIPMAAAGGVAGAAVYGAFKAIEEGDTATFGAIGIGAIGGAGISAAVGGMGLAGSFGAVGIGMGSMAAAGGVVGLGIYGLYKAVKQQPGERMAGAIDAFYRMESKVLEQEYYTQALLELDPLWAEYAWKQKFNAWEIEEELELLKHQTIPSSPSNAYPNLPPDTNQTHPSQPEAAVVPIQRKSPQTWQCVKVLKGHTASVNTIAISPDGETIVSGSDDKTVSLWNLNTGKQIFTFFGQGGEVCASAISPDGNMLVTGGFDNKITTWQLNTKKYLRPLLSPNSPYSHLGCICAITFSRDRKIIASASSDKTIRLWGGYTGDLKRTLNGHSDTVSCVAISPDGELIASGSADKTIRIWSLTSFTQPRILTGHSDWVTALAITTDGKILVSGSRDGTIKLWDIYSSELIRNINGGLEGIFSIAISPDGHTIASGSNQSVKIWQLSTGKLIDTIAGKNPVAFSPDGQNLVTGSKGGLMKIWRAMLGKDKSIFDPLVSEEWWEVLGVGIDADANIVKLAYHSLARQYHPDVNTAESAIAKMQVINRAYQAFLGKLSFEIET